MQKRIAFWGTPDLTIPILSTLTEEGYKPVLIITGEDKPVGRKQILTSPAPKTWAIENNVPYIQPKKIDSEFIEEFKKFNIDLSIVVAYGKILPKEIINLPLFKTINIHYSLLPRWRGASPVEAAILHGDKETGVCIQIMEETLDSGDIIWQEKIEIPDEITAPQLRDKLNAIAAANLPAVLNRYFNNEITPVKQSVDGITICKKFKKEDAEIFLNDDPIKNYNKYRAYFAWPKVFFYKEINGKKTRLKITKAKLVNNQFIIEKVIPEGGKEINYEN